MSTVKEGHENEPGNEDYSPHKLRTDYFILHAGSKTLSYLEGKFTYLDAEEADVAEGFAAAWERDRRELAELRRENRELSRTLTELTKGDEKILRRLEKADQAFQDIETQPGSPNFDGAAAWERYQKENPDWLLAPDTMPSDLAPAQMVEICDGWLNEARRADACPWGRAQFEYRLLYSNSGLKMVSAEGLEPWAMYVTTDEDEIVLQREGVPDGLYEEVGEWEPSLGLVDRAPSTHRIPGDWRGSIAEVMK